MNEAIIGNKLLRWKEAFESKGLRFSCDGPLVALQQMACLKVKLTHVVFAD